MGKPIPMKNLDVDGFTGYGIWSPHIKTPDLRGDLPGTLWLFASLLLPMQTHVGSRNQKRFQRAENRCHHQRDL